MLHFIEKANSDKNLELEIRFGKFKGGYFLPGVNLEEYDRLLKFVSRWANGNMACAATNSIEYIYNDFKCSVNNKTKTSSWMKKTKFETQDIQEYGYRICLSSEQDIDKPENPGEIVMFRSKNRISYIIDVFRYDITIAKESRSQRELAYVSPRYELEIEYIGNKGNASVDSDPEHVVEKINRHIHSVNQVIQNNYFVIKESEKNYVMDQYRKLTNSSSFVGSQPVTFEKSHIQQVQNGYAVTEKIDGDRTFMLISDNGHIFLIKSNMHIVKTGLYSEHNGLTLLDGEYVQTPKRSYFAFDILFHDGNDLRYKKDLNLFDRLKLVEEVTKKIQHPKPKDNEHIHDTNIYIKMFYDNIINGAKTILQSPHEYELDGLIYTPINEPYFNRNNLKWKPPHLNTIDFFVMFAGTNQGYVEWHLFVQTTEKDPHKEINLKNEFSDLEKNIWIKKFRTRENENAYKTLVQQNCLSKDGCLFYNRTVVECYYNANTKVWIPIRTRWDKTQNKTKRGGNFASVAYSIWNSIMNPVTENDICTTPPRATKQQVSTSLGSRKSSIVINLRTFHNEVKSTLLRNSLENTSDYSIALLDLASGKGGDLHKWSHNKLQTVVGFDINTEYIDEAKRRLKQSKAATDILFYQADLRSDNIYRLLKKNSSLMDFQIITCHFALHYFFEEEQYLDNFLKNVSENLKRGGYFIGTAFDGKKVHELLRNANVKKNGKYEKKENDTTIFSIEKKYSGKTFEKLSLFGQKIGVYLGGNTVMSQETDEYLVDFEKFFEYAKKYDLEPLPIDLDDKDKIGTPWINFSHFYNHIIQSASNLSDAEKEYSFLNNVFILTKTSPSNLEKVMLIDNSEEDEMRIEELMSKLNITPDQNISFIELPELWQRKMDHGKILIRQHSITKNPLTESLLFVAKNMEPSKNWTTRKLNNRFKDKNPLHVFSDLFNVSVFTLDDDMKLTLQTEDNYDSCIILYKEINVTVLHRNNLIEIAIKKDSIPSFLLGNESEDSSSVAIKKTYTLTELKNIARNAKVKGFSTMKKQELIDLLTEKELLN